MGVGSERADPRFQALPGGEANPKFRKQYAFLFDEQLPADRDNLKKSLKVCSIDFLLV